MKTNATVDAFSSDHWMNGNLDSLSWVINPPTISENSKDVLLSEAVENGFVIPTFLVPMMMGVYLTDRCTRYSPPESCVRNA
jgi:hypothetical protein